MKIPCSHETSQKPLSALANTLLLQVFDVYKGKILFVRCSAVCCFICTVDNSWLFCVCVLCVCYRIVVIVVIHCTCTVCDLCDRVCIWSNSPHKGWIMAVVCCCCCLLYLTVSIRDRAYGVDDW